MLTKRHFGVLSSVALALALFSGCSAADLPADGSAQSEIGEVEEAVGESCTSKTECGASEFCKGAVGECPSPWQPGVCASRPLGCPRMKLPVCGARAPVCRRSIVVRRCVAPQARSASTTARPRAARRSVGRSSARPAPGAAMPCGRCACLRDGSVSSELKPFSPGTLRGSWSGRAGPGPLNDS
jgi:hypothetical protein